jgi:hypothetical protein
LHAPLFFIYTFYTISQIFTCYASPRILDKIANFLTFIPESYFYIYMTPNEGIFTCYDHKRIPIKFGSRHYLLLFLPPLQYPFTPFFCSVIDHFIFYATARFLILLLFFYQRNILIEMQQSYFYSIPHKIFTTYRIF